MFYLIETEEQLREFSKDYSGEAFLQFIPIHSKFHPKLTSLSLVYVRPFNSHKGFMLCINHDESFPLAWSQIKETLDNFEKLYVLDKKYSLYFYQRNLYDVSLLNVFDTPDLDLYAHYYRKFADHYDLNKIVPIVKHYEYCENLYSSIDFENLDFTTEWYNFYNNKAIPLFYLIEDQGIKVDVDLIKNSFKPDDINYSIRENRLYSNYNLYTLTSRPSNTFNNINLGALNKKNGCRASFVPEHDKFVEFDYDSYHVRLLGDLVDYAFGDSNIHSYLGKRYFSVNDLTPEQYKESKGITFRILYTEKAIEEYQHIEFFKRVKEYKEKVWNEYQKNGFIRGKISGKPIQGIESKTQILPYILQNYETESNVVKLYDLIKYLSSKQSNIVSYNYDAVLIDFNENDGNETLEEIEKIMSKGGYPLGKKSGKNFDLLQKI